MNNKKTDYKSAGVDIEAGNEAVNLIKEKVKSTHTKEVLTGIGSFGSLYGIKEILSEENYIGNPKRIIITWLIRSWAQQYKMSL